MEKFSIIFICLWALGQHLWRLYILKCCSSTEFLVLTLHQEVQNKEKDVNHTFHFFFQIFQVVANLLELCNASVNFYMYCICNKDIRSHFWNILVSTCQKWKNGSKENDGQHSENLSSSKQRNSSISSDFFHKLRKNSVLFLPWAKVHPRDSLTGTTNTNIPVK